VDGHRFDAVLLACTAAEAARLAQTVAPAWASGAASFDYEPIVTVYLHSPGSRLPATMVALASGADAPAQFAFDLGALSPQRAGLFSFVASGARVWTERGLDACAEATLRQAQQSLRWRQAPRLLRAIAERRATFLCRPALLRPAVTVAPGLVAAGDYVEGPYPATLEGAVRSASLALRALG
jgi:predicted NAD/FAD-binding protein